jgi:mannose-6-phosphate isomerase
MSDKKENRPWGSFEVLCSNPQSTVKIINVLKNKRLSLQYHHHRDELWKVVSGSGKVLINDKIYDAKKGDEFFIPKLAHHRLIGSQSDDSFSIVEISTGHFDENDIVRLEDDFGRIIDAKLTETKADDIIEMIEGKKQFDKRFDSSVNHINSIKEIAKSDDFNIWLNDSDLNNNHDHNYELNVSVLDKMISNFNIDNLSMVNRKIKNAVKESNNQINNYVKEIKSNLNIDDSKFYKNDEFDNSDDYN